MELTDFLPVVVALNDDEKKIYIDILTSVGLPEPIVIEPCKPYSALEQAVIANKVAKIVDDKKAVIIGQKHYNITFCYDKED